MQERKGAKSMAVRPDMVGMVVRDMAATLRFYRLLELEIAEGVEGEPYVEVITPNGYRISWNTLEMVKGFDPDFVENPVGQRISLAFKCDSPAEVDALHEKIVAAGYTSHMAPWDAFWGQRYAVVVDPDGNNVDLFSAL
jgi:catechol 2,3-dioxygenase-like lactoylglutathione lyase family enzyme